MLEHEKDLSGGKIDEILIRLVVSSVVWSFNVSFLALITILCVNNMRGNWVNSFQWTKNFNV